MYQRTDRYEDFRADEGGYIDASVRSYHELLQKKSDMVVFVSKSLYEDERALCQNACLSDHGVDVKLFAEAEVDPRIPDELKGIARPIVGFFGAIDDHTFDISLATEVAKSLRDVSFVFVGHATSDVAELSGLPNVRMVGQRPHEEIPHYGKCFAVAIMPWRRTSWIEFCNPVKLKEYLALGKPVVSTPFAQLREYERFVRVAENHEQFVAAIRQALETHDSYDGREARERVRKDSWENLSDRLWRELVKNS